MLCQKLCRKASETSILNCRLRKRILTYSDSVRHLRNDPQVVQSTPGAFGSCGLFVKFGALLPTASWKWPGSGPPVIHFWSQGLHRWLLLHLPGNFALTCQERWPAAGVVSWNAFIFPWVLQFLQKIQLQMENDPEMEESALHPTSPFVFWKGSVTSWACKNDRDYMNKTKKW